MNQQERKELLTLLVELQDTCAKINVQIGGTKENGQVTHNTVYIEQCPPTVIKKLYAEGYGVSISDGRAMVHK